MSDPVIVAAAQGRHIQGPTGAPMTVKIEGRSVRGAYSLIEYSHEAGAPGPPPHVHHQHEEMFGVVAGELTVHVDDQVITLAAGDYAVVPCGAVHQPSNRGTVAARFFFVSSPAMDGFFVDMEQLNRASGGAPSPAALAELGARWDTSFVDLPTGEQNAVRMVNEGGS